MALEKPYILADLDIEFLNAYFRIERIHIPKNGTAAQIGMDIYKDKAAAMSGKDPVATGPYFIMVMDKSNSGKNYHSQGYVKAKTLNEMSGAKDV